MICKHENFMLTALQVVSPSLEGFNDGQQLAVVDLISGLCQNHLSRKKVIRGQLIENSTNSIAKSIQLNSDMTLRIKMI